MTPHRVVALDDWIREENPDPLVVDDVHLLVAIRSFAYTIGNVPDGDQPPIVLTKFERDGQKMLGIGLMLRDDAYMQFGVLASSMALYAANLFDDQSPYATEVVDSKTHEEIKPS